MAVLVTLGKLHRIVDLLLWQAGADDVSGTGSDHASGSCSCPGRVLHVEPVSAEQRGSHLGGQLSSALYNEPGNELTVLRYRITLGMQDIRWIQYLHCNYVR